MTQGLVHSLQQLLNQLPSHPIRYASGRCLDRVKIPNRPQTLAKISLSCDDVCLILLH